MVLSPLPYVAIDIVYTHRGGRIQINRLRVRVRVCVWGGGGAKIHR